MRSLVTGACGFIGGHLAAALAERGQQVVGVDNFSPYYDPAIKRETGQRLQQEFGVEIVEQDLRSCDVASLLHGVDVVFHMAAQPGVRPSWDVFDTYVTSNLMATQRLLSSCARSGVKRVAFASSSSIYGQTSRIVDEEAPTHPYSPYGVTKLAAESLCRAYAENYGLPTVSLRLFTVYGPSQRPDMAFQRLVSAASRGETFTIYGDGAQQRAFTYVGDVVEAAIRAATASVDPGTAINISGGSTTSLNEAIAEVQRAVGHPLSLRHEPDQAGDVRHTEADISRAKRLLGWTPRTPLREGIEAQVRAFQNSRHARAATSR